MRRSTEEESVVSLRLYRFNRADFAPRTLSVVLLVSSDMKVGDVVSVFSDLEGRCTRGATSFQGSKVFVGNGVAEMDRSSIFCAAEPARLLHSFRIFLLV